MDYLNLFTERFFSETRKELQQANGERDNNTNLIMILMSLSLLIIVGGAASLLSTYKFRKAKEDMDRQSKEKIDYLYNLVTSARYENRKFSNTGPAMRMEPGGLSELDDAMSTVSDHPGVIQAPGVVQAPPGGLLPAPASGRIRMQV